MQVKQSSDCSGQPVRFNEPTVTIPFSLYFRGFESGEEGTVVAYTQPGGEVVGERAVTIGPDGTRCVRVTGDAEPGKYKIVYDFGSGTGKQKVITIEGVGTPEPSETATSSETAAPSETAEPSQTATSSETAEPSATAEPSETAEPSQTATSSETAEPSETATPSASASVRPTSEVGKLVFTVLPVTGAAASGELAATGSGRPMTTGAYGVLLIALGALTLLVTGRLRRDAERAH